MTSNDLLRRGLRAGALAMAPVALAVTGAIAAQSPQVPLAPRVIPQFAQALPTVPNMQPVGGSAPLTLTMCEFDASILPPGTLVAGRTPATRVWGYIIGDVCPTAIPATQSYLGPVVIAERGTPTAINFVNALGSAATTGVLAYKYSVDQTLHWADPLGLNPTGGAALAPETNACNDLGGIPAFGSACAQNYAGPIPAVPHLHGGEVPPNLDGGPDAWWTSDGAVKGHGFYSMAGNGPTAAIYRYPNEQEAAPIWFHDHTLGATRLNVYAGLAGAYLVTDPTMTLAPGLHPAGLVDTVTGVVETTIPLVIQDRMFDTAGQLYFPADSSGGVLSATNPQHPYWVPEFTGDTIAVNGKVWPFLSVQPKRYRFLVLNGSNARTYELRLGNVPMWVIANDGGYLDAPAPTNILTIMPGERYEVIIDFRSAAVPNQVRNLVLSNSAKTPFPAGAQPPAATLGRVVQFQIQPCPRVGCPADNTYNPAAPTAPIRTPAMVRLANAGALAPGVVVNVTRQLTLNEVLAPPSTVTDPVTGILTNYPGGPLEILVNNTLWDGGVDAANNCVRPDFTQITLNGVTTCYSEVPNEGATEIWEIVNLTADAHPMHTHLTDFQILNRQPFNVKNYLAAYNAAFPGGLPLDGFGPPLDYNTGNPRALGGNPDITLFLSGAARPPAAYESGWKDTVITYPGEVTRFVVRFSPNSVPVGATGAAAAYPFDPNANGHGYVWHCHIVDHEDNEMMRPDIVQPLTNPDGTPLARSYLQGPDY